MYYLFSYFVVITLVTFVIRGWDKGSAIKKKPRIAEKTLLALCLFGGWLGGLLGMQLFRHKTIKGKFLYWFYGIVLVWIVGIVLLMVYY